MVKTGSPALNPAIFWLFGGTAFTTLIFNTKANDPFNAVKFWALLLVASSLIGTTTISIWSDFKVGRASRTEKIGLILVSIFIFTLLFDAAMTDVKFTAIFGDYQRRTGVIVYFCLGILILSAMKLTKLKDLRFLQFLIFCTAILMTFYGLLQHYHHDFVKWNNPYNPVLTTLGNPDFSSAVLGIFVVSIFGVVINTKFSKVYRILSASLGFLALLVIKFSEVTQGFIVVIVGCAFILLIYFYQKSKILGSLFLGLGIFISIGMIFGMLQIGPMTKFLYKSSVTFRGDYWRAGMRMFKTHPIFGVGLDRYGAYFGQYRDVTQVLRRGPDTLANNAHNIWIQFAATGGIILLFSYLALSLFVAWRAVYAIKIHQGSERLLVSSIVAMWLAFQAQAFISINNIGIAVWGALLSGVVIALSQIPELDLKFSASKKNIKRTRVSGVRRVPQVNFSSKITTVIFMTISIIGVSLFARSEVGMQNFAKVAMPKSPQEYFIFQNLADSELSVHPVDPHFVELISHEFVQTGEDFANSGDFKIALAALNKADFLVSALIKEDPRDLLALQVKARAQDSLSHIYSLQKDLPRAKLARQISLTMLMQFCNYDPLNTHAWLALGRSYQAAGDIASARSVIGKIAAIDPKGANLASAKKEFGA